VSGSGETAKVGGAQDIDAQAMDFLINRDLDEWLDADQAALENWLRESLAHRTAYWRLEAVWQRSNRLSALRPQVQQNDRALSRPRRRQIFLTAAVAFLAIGIASFATKHLFSVPRATTYATRVGEHRNIVLADGSRIELNTDTVLRATVDAQHRSVELLRGEALFQVRHDPAHPFVVFAAENRITDLGTKFLIREERGGVKVALIEGRARLESIDAQTSMKRIAILTVGDEAMATARKLSVTRKALEELQSELGWQRGVLVFHRASLVDVANEFNRYNRRKIVIADSGAAMRIISATLPANDAGAFARMAQNFLGLHVDQSDSEIVISR
jgi:transmembrane sensor